MKKLQLWCKAGKAIRIQIIYQKTFLEGVRLENWFGGEDD